MEPEDRLPDSRWNPGTYWVMTCRVGFEAELALEASAAGWNPPFGQGVPDSGVGWRAWNFPTPEAEAGARALPPFIFERQRLLRAQYVPLAEKKAGTPGRKPTPAGAPEGMDLEALSVAALLGSVRETLVAAPRPWTLHVYTPDPASGHIPQRRVDYLARRIAEKTKDVLGEALSTASTSQAVHHGTVWQVCLVERGLWHSVMPASELSHPHPGGVHALRRDDAAPSRSNLKLEEALLLLGVAPRAGERVVDLGAAPGGWSYACLRRGADVLAVDNGPLRIETPGELPGKLTHVRQDGLGYVPPPEWRPVDWLLSDMLVAPGECLGLLRRWLGGGGCRRFVVNVKLPQKQPLVALRPILSFLQGLEGGHWRMRQLFHDRREVTLMGEGLSPGALQKPGTSIPELQGRAVERPLQDVKAKSRSHKGKARLSARSGPKRKGK